MALQEERPWINSWLASISVRHREKGLSRQGNPRLSYIQNEPTSQNAWR